MKRFFVGIWRALRRRLPFYKSPVIIAREARAVDAQLKEVARLLRCSDDEIKDRLEKLIADTERLKIDAKKAEE